jgi:hypothetical protein
MAYANRLRVSTIAAAVGALFPVASTPAAGAADRAATVEFAMGEVRVVSLKGQSRPAAKGLPVQNGDTIETGGGRAQLRFTDGAYVSLQPQSKFRIDDYRFEGKADGSERGFFSLLSGGMRTITGLVGRTNKRTYQVTTSVATIGIRGTEYKIAYTNSIVGAVGEGAIDVCTGAGCFPFGSGESFLVPSPQSRPQLTDKQIDLPPEQPGNPAGGSFQESNEPTSGSGGTLVAGNEVDPSGAPAQLLLTGTQVLGGLYAYFPSVSPAVDDFDFGNVVLDSAGVVTNLDGKVSAAPLPGLGWGNDGYTAWGAFKDTAGFVIHYAVGLPPVGPLPVVASYELKGATLMSDGAGAELARLTAWKQTVNFSQGQLDGSAQWSITAGPAKGQTVKAVLGGSWDGPVYISGTCPDGSCSSLFARGYPFGPNGNRFGIAYQLTPANSPSGAGAAVLTQTSAQ